LNAETECNINMGDKRIYDLCTIWSEEFFFPLPSVIQNFASMHKQPTTVNEVTAGTASLEANHCGTNYAPMSMFRLRRVFTNEEIFYY